MLPRTGVSSHSLRPLTRPLQGITLDEAPTSDNQLPRSQSGGSPPWSILTNGHLWAQLNPERSSARLGRTYVQGVAWVEPSPRERALWKFLDLETVTVVNGFRDVTLSGSTGGIASPRRSWSKVTAFLSLVVSSSPLRLATKLSPLSFSPRPLKGPPPSNHH